jgi:antitoxin StbD
MNKPFRPEPILPVLADIGVSISELKRNPAAVIAAAREQQVAVLNRNRPVAYVISPEVWDHILDVLDDVRLEKLVAERLENPGELIEVSIDDL